MAELSGIISAYETRGKKLNDVIGERDDYRKVLEWYGEVIEEQGSITSKALIDRGKKARDILSRYTQTEKGDKPE